MELRTLEYVRALKSKHQCPVCFQPFVSPRVTPCGHTFCLGCLQNLAAPYKCPTCKTPIRMTDAAMLPPNVYVEERMAQLEVYCTHKKEGCGWSGARSQLVAHLTSECRYEGARCEYGCQAHVLSGAADQHRATCELAPLTCACGLSVLRKDIVHHLKNECTLAQPVCDFCGLEFESRAAIRDHLDDCQMTVVTCRYAELGCTNVGVRSVMEVHELSCPFSRLQDQRSELEALLVRTENLDSEAHNLERLFEERTDTLAELRKLLETQRAQINLVRMKQSSLESSMLERNEVLHRVTRKMESLGVPVASLATSASSHSMLDDAAVAISISDGLSQPTLHVRHPSTGGGSSASIHGPRSSHSGDEESHAHSHHTHLLNAAAMADSSQMSQAHSHGNLLAAGVSASRPDLRNSRMAGSALGLQQTSSGTSPPHAVLHQQQQQLLADGASKADPKRVVLVCKNCKGVYQPSANFPNSCSYHPGKRVVTTLAGTKKEIKAWSCCGSNMKSRSVGGCRSGEHVPQAHFTGL